MNTVARFAGSIRFQGTVITSNLPEKKKKCTVNHEIIYNENKELQSEKVEF
jgi:hypothetical protein